MAVFGSVLRDDFHDDSDIDLLVEFAPEARHGLMSLAQMQDEFEALCSRKVDLVTKESVERSSNYIRRKDILKSARSIYVA